MKKTIYKANWQQIAKKAFLPLLPLIVQIGFNVFILIDNSLNIQEILFVNLLWGLILSFPGLLLFLNYLSNSLNTCLVLEFNKIRLESKFINIELDTHQIDKIEIRTTKEYNRMPWGFLEYYVFKQGDKEIVFNNLTLEISHLWEDSLSRKINKGNVEFKYLWYPWMKS